MLQVPRLFRLTSLGSRFFQKGVPPDSTSQLFGAGRTHSSRAIAQGTRLAQRAISREQALERKSRAPDIEAGHKAYRAALHRSGATRGQKLAKSGKRGEEDYRGSFPVFAGGGGRVRALAKAGALATVTATACVALFPESVESAVVSGIRLFQAPSFVKVIQNRANCAEMEFFHVNGHLVAGRANRDVDCSQATAYRFTPVDNVNREVRLQALTAVEGEAGSILTFNFTGLARALSKGLRIGGSPPDLSTIEFIWGDGAEISHLEKAYSVFVQGPVTAAFIAPTRDERASLALNHMPCLRGIGGFGPTVKRLSGGYCNLVVGKKPGDQLTSVESCVISVTPYRQLGVPGVRAGQVAIEAMEEQFAAIKERAATRCLEKLWSGASLAAAYRELNGIAAPDLEFLLFYGRASTADFPGAQTFITEIQARGGEVTLDPAAQQAAVREIKRGRDEVIAQRVDVSLCIAFGEDGCASEDQIDLALLLAQPSATGALIPRVAYQNRPGILTHRAHKGQRSWASTVKPLLVPLIIEELGDDGLTIDLCRQNANGLRDADGSTGGDCLAAQDWLTLEEALARSSNLAFNFALSKIDENKLRAYLELVGFNVPADLKGFQLRRSVILGDRVTISADALVRGYATVALGRAMQAPMGLDQTGEKHPLVLSDFVSPVALQRATEVLKSPVNHPRGTARSTAAVARAADCRVLQAKTGTADSSIAPLARDRIFIAVISCGDRRTVVFALLGTPSPERILGKRLRSRDLNELAVRTAIATLRAERS